ncbi:hypothetical protein P7K49_015715, partial [Saguinus oedipus]
MAHSGRRRRCRHCRRQNSRAECALLPSRRELRRGVRRGGATVDRPRPRAAPPLAAPVPAPG